MSMNNANISISADNRSAIEQTQKLTKSVQDLNKTVSESGKVVSSAKSSWALYVAAFNQYVTAINTVASGLKTAMDFGKEISAFDSVRNAFEKYTSSVGSKSDELLQKMRTVSGGVIDDMRLMQSLSNAMAKGITTDANKLSDLMKVASQKAKIFGKEGGQAFNDLVNAINTGSEKALTEVGIKLPEGFEKLTKNMTKSEKQSKLLEIAISEGKKEISKMGGELEDSSDSFARFETAMKNLKTTSGTVLLPALSSVAEMLTKILNKTEDVILGLQEIFKDKPDINYNLVTSKSLKGLESITKKKIEDYQNEINSLKFVSSGGGAGMPNSYAIANGGGTNNETYQNRIKRNEQILVLEAKIKDEQKKLTEIQKNLGYALEREKEVREEIKTIVNDTNNSASTTGDTVTKTTQKTKDDLEKINEENEKLFQRFANLSDSLLPDIVKSEKEAYDIFLKISLQAGGLTSHFDKVAASAKKLEQELENAKAQKDIFNLNNDMSTLDRAAGFTNIGLGMFSGNLIQNAISSGDFKEDFKKGYFSIRQALEEDLAGAVTNGIINSNLGEVLRSMVSSLAASKASSYGSTLLGGLFSGNGFAGLGGAVSGFVGSIAVSAIANNWEKWFGDHGKEETMAKNAETRERGANAYLSTYSAMLNPYMTDEMLYNLLDSRSGASNMIVKYKSKRAGGLRGVVGGKNYSDATPQETFDLIDAMESAVEAVEDYNKTKTKELELLEAQGYSYTVLGEQMTALSDTMERIGGLGANQSYTWDNGQKYSIDLSDSIQDLKKAYYEALREYGQETANRTTQSATNFLSLFPFVDSVNYGSAGSEWIENLVEYTDTYNVGLERLREAVKEGREFGFNVLYNEAADGFTFFSDPLWNSGTKARRDAANALSGKIMDAWRNRHQTQTITRVVDEGYMNSWDDRGSVGANANIEDVFNAVSKLTTDFLDRNATAGMLDVIKQAGANQFNLNALQYSGNQSDYTSAYLKVLERQQEAAQLVMKQQEEIYLDATKTFEEQSAALDMYQQAQDQYYSTKLEILAQEAAKEEQIKKEEAAANLRRQEQMEALLGFTGEIARTGNNVYILEGADQIGALKEMIQQYGDDPEALAALQAMLSAAQSKAKFGKIA